MPWIVKESVYENRLNSCSYYEFASFLMRFPRLNDYIVSFPISRHRPQHRPLKIPMIPIYEYIGVQVFHFSIRDWGYLLKPEISPAEVHFDFGTVVQRCGHHQVDVAVADAPVGYGFGLR